LSWRELSGLTFSLIDKGLDEANAKGWTVVSMKDDWKTDEPDDGLLGLPSFHEGNGSAARAVVVVKATAARSATAKRFWRRMVFIGFSSSSNPISPP
jgi:hypothetical protein